LKDVNLSPEEIKMIKGFCFLSLKPLINLINTDENSYREMLPFEEKLENTYVFSAKIEKELLELDIEEREIFEEEFGMKDYQYLKETFKNKCYKSMGLISFFTVGSDETKAWTIPLDYSAYLAAGKIHSDIQQGFIRAEVIEWDKLLESGGFNEAKKKGQLRLEGKDYSIKDGEIVHFRFNK
jgi:ribosome-binding ATPase YchF (GTP1/OBG family)